MTARRSLALVGVAILLSACDLLAPSPADRVYLENDTTTDVSVHVNGGFAATVPAGSAADVPIQGHGGPPFRIEARSRSGAVLFDMEISATDYQQVRDGQASMSSGVAPGCGWIEVNYGVADPNAPVAPEAPVGRTAPGGVCP